MEQSAGKKTIVYIKGKLDSPVLNSLQSDFEVLVFDTTFNFNSWLDEKHPFQLLIASGTEENIPFLFILKQLKNNPTLKNIPCILLAPVITDRLRNIAYEEGISDVFDWETPISVLKYRIDFLIDTASAQAGKEQNVQLREYRMPVMKRLFDIGASAMALLCLSPILALIAIAIRLESKGPVFYASKRVGTGYKVFDFYKFRSMYVNADARLKDMQHLNQYGSSSEPKVSMQADWELCEDCKAMGNCQQLLYFDKRMICEKQYLLRKKEKKVQPFIKIANDPRITKVGQFIRNTSLDELPQLVNVLIGDMSLVGNRPLPLYEAEQLTTDQFSLRFIAPAGITGLWQVTKRGASSMSAEERIALDNNYAREVSFKNDIRILLKTIPALFQKENV